MMKHALVVDDDQMLRRLLKRYLSKNGFLVSEASNAQDAWLKLQFIQFDCLILDRMMPGQNGVDFSKDVRKGRNNIPILMLTAMSEVSDRIEGLESGVDDYLSKPFEPKELLLRLKSILRRGRKEEHPEERDDELVINKIALGSAEFSIQTKMLERNGTQIHLTTAEVDLLTIFCTHINEVFSRDRLAKLLEISGGERAIDVQVTRLRKKLEENIKKPRHIQTVRGQGYVLRT